jgi:hypothetical protein
VPATTTSVRPLKPMRRAGDSLIGGYILPIYRTDPAIRAYQGMVKKAPGYVRVCPGLTPRGALWPSARAIRTAGIRPRAASNRRERRLLSSQRHRSSRGYGQAIRRDRCRRPSSRPSSLAGRRCDRQARHPGRTRRRPRAGLPRCPADSRPASSSRLARGRGIRPAPSHRPGLALRRARSRRILGQAVRTARRRLLRAQRDPPRPSGRPRTPSPPRPPLRSAALPGRSCLAWCSP